MGGNHERSVGSTVGSCVGLFVVLVVDVVGMLVGGLLGWVVGWMVGDEVESVSDDLIQRSWMVASYAEEDGECAHTLEISLVCPI